MKTNKRLYWIIASGFLIYFMLCLISYGLKKTEQAWVETQPSIETQPSVETPTSSRPKVYQEIIGFTLTEYLAGMKKLEVKAEKATLKPKRIGFLITPLIKEMHMVKPEILYFTDDKQRSSIAADSGTMNMVNKRLLLKGNVRLVTSDGKRLFAKEAAVDPKKGLLSVGDNFTLHRDGEVIKGKGFQSDIELKKPTIRTRQ